MKTSDFNKKLSSSQIHENINKMFGVRVNLEKYNREQLEDMRNKLRTRLFQHENKAGVNDLLTNETYQKDKAMLDLLNTRIKEMLGEDIKKLKDKLQQLDEAKKGVRAPKFTKKAKGSDKTGDGKSDFDDVQVARMVAGGVPKKKAIAKATSDEFKEDRVVRGTRYGGSAQKDTDYEHSDTPSKGSSEKTAADRAKDKAADKEQERAGKDWEARGYKRTVVKGKSQSGSPKDDDDDTNESRIKEGAKSCNHTPKGKSCPEHGLKECPQMKESVEKVTDKKSAVKNPPTNKKASVKKTKKKTDESLAIYRRNVKIVNESLSYLIQEDEEEKAAAITAAGDMANDFTSWMQRVGQYQTKVMIELSDEIRHNFGAQQAEAFKQAVGPALSATLEVLTQQREAISNAIAALAGGEVPAPAMGTEPVAPEEPMEPAMPDAMNEPAPDEFAASDAAAGAGTPGREMRESKFSRKLSESHSIISKLAK